MNDLPLQGELVLRRLIDAMRKKYIDERNSYRRYYEDKGYEIVFVHELCECSRKMRYSKLFPEIGILKLFKPHVIRGELIHLALEGISNMKANVKSEKRVKINNRDFLIAGSVDLYDESRKRVIEIKTVKSIANTPFEHHILQTRMYLWLLNVKDAELWYFASDGVKFYYINNPCTDSEIQEIINNPSAPRWPQWECNMCEYDQLCELKIQGTK
jgi:CRISPR-associated exonuclease Cas4